MNKLLKIEWTKIYYYRATRIFTLLYFVSLILIGVILAFIKPEVGGVKLNLAKLGMFNFPVVWQNIAYIVAILKIFLAVIIIMNITNEYSNRTLKQNLIDGLSKKEFLGSKMLTNLILAFLSTLFVLGLSIVLGLIFSETDHSVWEGAMMAVMYLLKLILFFSLCMFLALWLRKTAFAFLGIIVLWMVEGAITLAEVLIRAFLGDGLTQVKENMFLISNYLPLNVSSNLVQFPKLEISGFVMGGSIFTYNPTSWTYMLAAVIYILIFVFFSYGLLKRRDL